MSYEYYTMVKASRGFWEKLLSKKIDEDSHIKILNINPDEIIITSKNRTALSRIIALSKEYPEEIFKVKIAGENVYENYVSLYECSKGRSKLIKEGFEYCFGIKVSDRDKIDKGMLDDYKKKVADYFLKLEQKSYNKVNLELNFDDIPNEEYDKNLSVIIEYITDKARLTAKKYGMTFIKVDVAFFDNKDILLKEETQANIDCYDLGV